MAFYGRGQPGPSSFGIGGLGVRAVWLLGLTLAGLLHVPCAQAASTDSSAPLTLANAVDIASTDYPQVKVALAEEVVADRNVDVARAESWPQVNLLWQINRATVNNITGYFFPQAVLPTITGAVAPSTGRTIWDDGVGVLADWNVIDGGVRAARVEAARHASEAARHDYDLTEIQVIQATASAIGNGCSRSPASER